VILREEAVDHQKSALPLRGQGWNISGNDESSAD